MQVSVISHRLTSDGVKYEKVKVKVRTLVIAPLTGKPASEALKEWHAL